MEDEEEGKAETAITTKFTWSIKNFSELNSHKNILYSHTFYTGSHPWRIVIYPKGVNYKGEFLSPFLNAGDFADFPVGWSRFATFKLSLINQFDVIMTVKIETFRILSNNSSRVSIGFPMFISSAIFHDPKKGFLVKDKCIIVAEVSIENSTHEDIHNPLIDFGKIDIKDFDVQLLEQVRWNYSWLFLVILFSVEIISFEN